MKSDLHDKNIHDNFFYIQLKWILYNVKMVSWVSTKGWSIDDCQPSAIYSVPLEHCDYKGGSSEGKKVVCACKKAGVVCIYDIWERKF